MPLGGGIDGTICTRAPDTTSRRGRAGLDLPFTEVSQFRSTASPEPRDTARPGGVQPGKRSVRMVGRSWSPGRRFFGQKRSALRNAISPLDVWSTDTGCVKSHARSRERAGERHHDRHGTHFPPCAACRRGGAGSGFVRVWRRKPDRRASALCTRPDRIGRGPDAPGTPSGGCDLPRRHQLRRSGRRLPGDRLSRHGCHPCRHDGRRPEARPFRLRAS